MQIILVKQDDGNMTVVVKRTKVSEGPTIVTANVRPADVSKVVEEVLPVIKNGGVRPT